LSLTLPKGIKPIHNPEPYLLNFAESMLAWVGATVFPVLAGLVLITVLSRVVSTRYLAAFASGIFLWFFVDTIAGSADLDVNAGFGGGVMQAGMVLLFVAGILLFLATDRRLFLDGQLDMHKGLLVSMLVALALGIHGFGEGTAFGSTAASTSSTSLWGPEGAFGGIMAGAAYVMHKALEPMIVGAMYAVSLGDRGLKLTRCTRDIGTLALLFTLPSIVGAVTGYFVAYDATYFFALGAGASIYAALRLAKQLFQAEGLGARRTSLRVGLSLIIGFILIYATALLHS
jgi:zinc transporter ZupT